MRVRSAVLSSLALVPLLASSSCGRTGCDAPTERFDFDEPVTAAEIDHIIATGYAGQADWASVKCETVCKNAYHRVHRWHATTVASCTLGLPEKPEGTGAKGRVTCSGTGVEYFCEGRRPLAHSEARDEGCEDALGRSLAAMAYLEAASVLAFEELAAWLRAQRAPAELIERCQAAADDERCHARWLTCLAQERGAVVPVPTPRDASEASVLEVALHNAVEGCVHESFAALMAAVRAERAGDLRLRRVFARLAVDEARHGQLAWDLHAWLRERLEPAQVRVMDALQRQALAQLPSRARAAQAGLPTALGDLDDERVETLAACLAARLAA
jgi:hypothetical protein